jgi:hypothetical protein
MTDDYRAQLLASVQDMQNEQFRQHVRTMSNEDLDNAVCDSIGVPRGTVFSIEQLELLIASANMRQDALEGLKAE